MKKTLLASAALASLLLAGSVQAQSNQGQSGSPEKGPANAGPSHQPSATATQPESRESAAPRARGAQTEENGGAPHQATPGKSAEKPTGPGEHGRAERNEGNASKAAQAPGKEGAEEKGRTEEKGRAERNEGAGGKAAQSPASSHDRNAESKPGTSHEPTRAEHDQPGAGKSAQSPTTGQEKNAQSRDTKNPQPGQADRNMPNERSGGSATGTAQTGQQGGGNRASVSVGAGQSVNLDAKAQTQVRDFVARDRSARVDHVDFNLSVGARVPEHVHYRPLPSELVSVFPQYRGYDYVVANDEIVIIEPRTREIVTVVAASGGEGRGRVPAHHARLSHTQERVVYTDAMRGARPITRSIDVRVGERISADIDLMPLPQAILRESPDFGEYRYFVVNREVVLVDPQTREIVDVIRE
ncbi:MAG: DUF1236 domain-containing protein [Beijerinckiaceae bacterium]